MYTDLTVVRILRQQKKTVTGKLRNHIMVQGKRQLTNVFPALCPALQNKEALFSNRSILSGRALFAFRGLFVNYVSIDVSTDK